MRQSVVFIVITAFMVLSTLAQRRVNVKYSELQELGADCYPRDTCRMDRTSNSLMSSFCLCGPVCRMLDACCVDARYKNAPRDPNLTPHVCRLQHHQYSMRAFMIEKCHARWNGDKYITRMCLADGNQLNDPLLLIPVTNTRKRATYKNAFCAACNGERPEDMYSWNMYIFVQRDNGGFRNITKSEMKKLKYTRDVNWKIDGSDETARLDLNIPKEISQYVYECPKREIISTCASNWTDVVVARKCASYMGIVVSDYKRYRNAHCALCNYRRMDSLTCELITAADPGDLGKIPFHFGLLLDVNRANGDLVGKRRPCRKNEIYHPTMDKCIRLAGCLRGYHLDDGKCVRG